MFGRSVFSETDITGLLLLANDKSMGTLWWVENSLWLEAGLPIGNEQGEKPPHPGVSLLRKPVRCLGAVPMVFGTSDPPTSKRRVHVKTAHDVATSVTPGQKPPSFYFCAQGLSTERPPKTTYFGLLGKRDLSTQEFATQGIAPVLVTDSGGPQEPENQTPRIRPNKVKSVLSQNEQSDLEAWMKLKRLWS